MLKAKAKWIIKDDIDQGAVAQLAEHLNIDPLIAHLLVARGLTDREEAAQFLDSDRLTLHDPFMMLGMEKAIARLNNALQHGESILIYGDYDADGISATALLMTVLTELKADVHDYIPHRIEEGYGLNNEAIKQAHDEGVSVILTVDNGISAVEQIDYATSLGIDIIVTDHHEPPAQLPAAYAIVNPKQPGCPYPFKQLAGVGIALQVAHALLGELPLPLLQYAAIGTIADIVPLRGENRLIVKHGLAEMRRKPHIAIKALCQVAGIDEQELNEEHIGFNIGPRINAGGRIGDGRKGVQLLLATSEEEAAQLAHELDLLNRERQQMVNDITAEALDMYNTVGVGSHAFVLGDKHWHAGVIGIVASKFVERFYRPTIIMQLDPGAGIAKGSARSIQGFNMYEALSACEHLLSHYGGHEMAAGLTMPLDNIPSFKKQLNELAESWLDDEDLTPVMIADKVCAVSEVTLDMIDQMQQLAPFGADNHSPLFVLKNLRIHDMRLLGKEQQHLKLLVSDAGGDSSATLEAIGFGIGAWAQLITASASIDLLGELSINEWNGLRKPQLRIHDMRIVERQAFDWRGTVGLSKKQQWLAFMEEQSHWQWHPALLVSSAAEGDELIANSDVDLTQYAFWLMSEGGQVLPLNEVAQQENFQNATDVFICSLPPNLATLQAILGQAHQAERIYALFKDASGPSSAVPPREVFGRVYTELVHAHQWQQRDERFMQHLQRRTGMSQQMISFIITVFEELSFIARTGTTYYCVDEPERRELHTSVAYKQRAERVALEETLVFSTSQQLTQWIINQLPTTTNIYEKVEDRT